MRFSLIDLFFATGCWILGGLLGSFLFPEMSRGMRVTVWIISGFLPYLALVYPVYRGLRLLPMILPWCPHCRKLKEGYRILGGGWPRIRFQCPLCNGAFVIWYNGKVGDRETWEEPVLALKWPYAFGWYRRMNRATIGHESKIGEKG